MFFTNNFKYHIFVVFFTHKVFQIFIEMIWLKNYQNNIYTTSSHAATSLCFKGGGVLVEIQGNIFLMNFDLLTFPCREMIKLSIHI